MKDRTTIEFAKAFNEAYKTAFSEINTCFYPGCNENSINTHILQKNGILSSIAPSRHLMEQSIDQHKSPPIFFKKIGIDKAFSFNCFCKNHDNSLFKEIEDSPIDFYNYKHQILLTLRTILNEKYKKLIVIRQNEILLSNNPNLKSTGIQEFNAQQKLGLKDLESIEKKIWNDINSQDKSFVFIFRKIPIKEICLSSYFTFETTNEIQNHYVKYGKDPDHITDIFVNLVPYRNKSYFMIGYEKSYEKKVKKFVPHFMKCWIFPSTIFRKKRLEKWITNILVFHCENWVCSESFYNSKIKPVESFFYEADLFSSKNNDERIIFDLNMFRKNFPEKIHKWKKEYVG